MKHDDVPSLATLNNQRGHVEDMEGSHDDEGSIVEEVFGPDLGWVCPAKWEYTRII